MSFHSYKEAIDGAPEAKNMVPVYPVYGEDLEYDDDEHVFHGFFNNALTEHERLAKEEWAGMCLDDAAWP